MPLIGLLMTSASFPPLVSIWQIDVMTFGARAYPLLNGADMGRALLVLANDHFRQKAIDCIWRAPMDTRVEFKGPKRSTPQNDRMWAMLTDISLQLAWHGLQLTTED